MGHLPLCFSNVPPSTHTEWSVAIVCPENDIFEPYYRLRTNLITITIIGICLLLFFCLFIIRYNLRPLKQLGLSAERISQGDFDVIVPDSRRRDEIGQLQHSFYKMQRSLVDYINKIRHSTEVLTQQNAELTKATELAKEDDRMKTAVINNMTGQMLHPVDIIVAENDLIRQEYENLSEEEMTQHVDRMLESTEDVTRLLNQILKASDASSDTSASSDSSDLLNESPVTP